MRAAGGGPAGARRGRRLLVAALLTAGMLSPAQPSTDPNGLREIATMPSGSGTAVLRMLVDSGLNLGFAIGAVEAGPGRVEQHLLVYDLAAMRLETSVPVPYFGLSGELATIDERNHRLFFPPGPKSVDSTSAGCETGPKEAMGVAQFDIETRAWSLRPVPCAGPDQFKTQSLSYHAGSDKLYALGAPQTEWSARSLGVVNDRWQQTLLLRQMDARDMSLDWEVDLRAAGCDAVVAGQFGGLVQRFEDSVLSYCYGPRNSLEGSQGYAIRIPLGDDDRPVPGTGTLPQIRVTPTLPNDLFPLVDPGTGRMLLLTVGSANGDAVWVFDPFAERFLGVIATGQAGRPDPGATIYVGQNAASGRAYLMSSRGVLVADTRHDPLPSGLSYPVLDDVRDQGAGPFIAVAPALRRLFVPVAGKGFVVLEDGVGEPPTFEAPDPDRGTADIAETPGATESVYSGFGGGYGAHALVTGGVSRAVNNADPLCYSLLSIAVKDQRGRCLAEQLFTGGNRELFLAATSVNASSSAGVDAAATGGAFSSQDTASDADFRRAGACFEDVPRSRTGTAPPPSYAAACDSSPLASFRSGTRGPDGNGYPIPGSHCENAGTAEQPDAAGAAGPVAEHAGSSSASCDEAASAAAAEADASALAVPGPSNPLVSAAHVESRTETKLTGDGVVTAVTATADGVRIGEDVSIARVQTVVTTIAHGRTGTTKTVFTRSLSGVRTPGFSCETCDPEAAIGAMNAALGTRMRVSRPPALQLASPKGFQAVVVKDPKQRSSDRTMNDDDTFEVPGLEVVVYNDGRFGRSRLVVHLAGARAESRYGIFPLPETGDGVSFGPAGPGGGEPRVGGVQYVPVVEPGAPAPEDGGAGMTKIVRYPVQAVADGLRLIVTNPREFALLFLMWGLLAMPLYLGARRRLAREEMDR